MTQFMLETERLKLEQSTFHWQKKRREMLEPIKDSKFTWVIILKSNFDFVGHISIVQNDKIGELDYHIEENCRRKGYAYEAITCIKNHAFNHLQLSLLQANVKKIILPHKNYSLN